MKKFFANWKSNGKKVLMIQFTSDEHVETYYDSDTLQLEVLDDTDVVILAGDIGSGSQVTELIKKYAEKYPRKIFVFVAGNHEFYSRHYWGLHEHYDKEINAIENCYYLERGILYIGSVRILGCTLWSGFDLYGTERVREMGKLAESRVNDFRRIKFGKTMMVWQDQRRLNLESGQFLEDALEEPWGGETVVVTHWPPIPQCVNNKYGAGILKNPLTAYFNNDLSDLVRENKIYAWLYGHHHVHQAFEWEGTWFYSNPCGYEWEKDLEHDREFKLEILIVGEE